MPPRPAPGPARGVAAKSARDALGATGRRNRKYTAGVLLLWALLLAGTTASADSYAALQKAAMLVQQARLDEAEQQARLALADPETQAVAYSVLGTIRFRQNRLEDSATFLQDAIRLDSRLLGAHLNLGQVYALQGKPQQALELYDAALISEARLALRRCVRPLRSRSARVSSNDRSHIGCERKRSSRTIRRFCWDSAASA